LPPASYTGADDGVGETPPQGWTRTFPHALKGTADRVDGSYFAQWERSPFADAYVGRFAAALVQSLQLGAHDGTDVLAISFSSPDLVGHAFGPRSQEVQDMYARLDKTIGALFTQLDASVGKDQWVVGLTADHGVTPIPEQLAAEGKDAGRISGGGLVDAIEQVLKPALGEGRHVLVLNTNDIYFEPGVYTKISKSRELMTSLIAAIQSRPGIQRAFRSEEIRGAEKSRDPLLRAAALSYFPGRSGDIVFATKPGWMISGAGTTHGSANADDQRVPVLFYGRGIKPGKYQDVATPADVTPTLAAISGLAMKAEGHALACVQ
jgi:predicted AlkP superfamily pyrophosphatase or phosphodiesterase